jgi:chromosome segregation protein
VKIDYIEMCGFRGFRDKVRLDLASGFVVITGRNGVGKSTICDAIEFALTGNIDKYRVEKAAEETLSDYLWWRGEGAGPGHYVTVGFSYDQGGKIEMTRSRQDGANMAAHDIESALCVAGIACHRTKLNPIVASSFIGSL